MGNFQNSCRVVIEYFLWKVSFNTLGNFAHSFFKIMPGNSESLNNQRKHIKQQAFLWTLRLRKQLIKLTDSPQNHLQMSEDEHPHPA